MTGIKGMPGRPCPPGCGCGRHARPHQTPEERRENKRRQNHESRERQRAADPEGFAHRAREQSSLRRAANPEKAAEQVRRSAAKHRQARNARKREKHRLTYDPDVQWGVRLWTCHGWRPEQWTQQWHEQGGRCYLGGEPLPANRSKVVIDHDYSCCPRNKSCADCRRGLACADHNSGIGYFQDDPELMMRAAAALAAAKAAAAVRIAGKPVQCTLPLDELEVRRSGRAMNPAPVSEQPGSGVPGQATGHRQ
jgi:hypothetical protein